MLSLVPVAATMAPGKPGMAPAVPELGATWERMPVADVEGWQRLQLAGETPNGLAIEPPVSSRPSVRGGSTYQERLNQTPRRNGWWSGERGESTFYSYNQEVNTLTNGHGIPYSNARVDFSSVAIEQVEITGMSIDRLANFAAADEALAQRLGVSAAEIEAWRMENSFSWHEMEDLVSMQLVPTNVQLRARSAVP